ncbi:MAG TPA: Holliday junction resolvase RuvX [Pyrinomonadaceae bacterium]|nr:Holliday junction resolvase RuvX [Pyrinomonadaceae bacterium]
MENTQGRYADDNPRPPMVALDLGEKRIGVAVSDELSITITRLKVLRRTNWKQLLQDVDAIVRRFDAKSLVIGLPLQANGSSGDAAAAIRTEAEKFARSLSIPVYLQNERLSSVEAEENLRADGHPKKRIQELIDAEAAAIILRDFIVTSEARTLVQPGKDS